jgi:hypothetical protein
MKLKEAEKLLLQYIFIQVIILFLLIVVRALL